VPPQATWQRAVAEAASRIAARRVRRAFRLATRAGDGFGSKSATRLVK
jgi:hypothetical protein